MASHEIVVKVESFSTEVRVPAMGAEGSFASPLKQCATDYGRR